MIFGLATEIWPICHFKESSSRRRNFKMTIWPYLSPQAKYQKDKGTLLPSTFKVEEKKVPLFLFFLAKGLRYGHLFISKKAHREEQPSKWQYGHISVPRQNLKKIKLLCFLELLKLKKRKYLYFFDFMPRDWDMDHFKRQPGFLCIFHWVGKNIAVLSILWKITVWKLFSGYINI